LEKKNRWVQKNVRIGIENMMDFDLLFDRSDLPYVLKQAKTLSKEECRAIYNYFEEYKPKRILEFGTQYGCSTRVFIEISKWFGLDAEVHSWDINCQIRKDCVDRNSFTFHQEDITGKEKHIIDTFRPDLVFLDAHPYELTKNLMTVCIEKDINFMCHDVSVEIYERSKLRSNNFTNKNPSNGTEWELYLLKELISKDIINRDFFENDKIIVECVRDRFGLAIIKTKK